MFHRSVFEDVLHRAFHFNWYIIYCFEYCLFCVHVNSFFFFVLFILCNFFCVPLYCASDSQQSNRKNWNIRKIMISSEPTPNSIQLIRVHFAGNYQQINSFFRSVTFALFLPISVPYWKGGYAVSHFVLWFFFLTFGVFF